MFKNIKEDIARPEGAKLGPMTTDGSENGKKESAQDKKKEDCTVTKKSFPTTAKSKQPDDGDDSSSSSSSTSTRNVSTDHGTYTKRYEPCLFRN